MRPALMKETLGALFDMGRTVAIEGPPGGGKTTLVHEANNARGKPTIEKHLPTMLVEDFGIPYPTDTGVTYKIPDWFPAQGRPGTDKGGVLLFDDRNQAGPDIQKVLANICQSRTLHGVPLADGWTVVSTGNRQSDRAGANRILSHLRNRETVLELETHLDDSTQWMLDHGIKAEIISFLRFRPNLLHDFDPSRDVNPTPRSWAEGVSPILGAVPSEAEYECIKGAIGEGAAAEFLGFLRIFRSLPDPDTILSRPLEAEVPTDPATLYAIAGTVAERANEGNMDKVCLYIGRLPPEFSVLCMSYAARKNPAITGTAAFVQWCSQNQSVLF